MEKNTQDDNKKTPFQLIGYFCGIAIILFIIFGIGFSIWGIFNTM